MTGVIEGSTSYLIAGYVLAWAVLTTYAFSLWFRRRNAKKG